MRALDLVGDKWTLLIIRDLTTGPRRFVDLQRVLPSISTEQLRSRLNRMVADGLVTRQRYREVPPRVDYELTERAHALVGVIAELARWGYRWAWGAPRLGEHVDIDAVLRATAGLIALPEAIDARVELVVDGRPLTVELVDGRGVLHEGGSDGPDARIAGSKEDWIAALGPEAADDALDVTGDHVLAERVLAAMGPAAGTAAAHAA